MLFERAQEILASSATIEVQYNGSPVWIEHLNPGNRTALVTADALPKRGQNVPVQELVEM